MLDGLSKWLKKVVHVDLSKLIVNFEMKTSLLSLKHHSFSFTHISCALTISGLHEFGVAIFGCGPGYGGYMWPLHLNGMFGGVGGDVRRGWVILWVWEGEEESKCRMRNSSSCSFEEWEAGAYLVKMGYSLSHILTKKLSTWTSIKPVKTDLLQLMTKLDQLQTSYHVPENVWLVHQVGHWLIHQLYIIQWMTSLPSQWPTWTTYKPTANIFCS